MFGQRDRRARAGGDSLPGRELVRFREVTLDQEPTVPVSSSVFGLDETQRATLGDMRRRFDSPEIAGGVRDTGGRVSLAVYRCTKPVIAAINGPAVGSAPP